MKSFNTHKKNLLKTLRKQAMQLEKLWNAGKFKEAEKVQQKLQKLITQYHDNGGLVLTRYIKSSIKQNQLPNKIDSYIEKCFKEEVLGESDFAELKFYVSNSALKDVLSFLQKEFPGQKFSTGTLNQHDWKVKELETSYTFETKEII